VYDVIVVGARVAGSSTALLLARAALRVLVLDQARFPSDTLSSHQLQVPAVARLARWGLLERVLATGVPEVRRVRFENAGVVLNGFYPAVDGVDAMLSPRRTVFDALLVDAARDAGAEVREATTMSGLIETDGAVTGVRFRSKGSGSDSTEAARIVVGADGHHSRIARLVRAREYNTQPSHSIAFYRYWHDLPLVAGGEMYSFDDGVAAAWPTNDGLTMTYVGASTNAFDRFRADREGSLLASLDRAGTLGERARAATPASPARGTNDLPNLFRVPHGPGWALVGDAGLVMDPITGLGMGHALRDGELASAAIIAGLDQGGRLDRELASYTRQRDKQSKPIYDFTVGLSKLARTSNAEKALFTALAADYHATGTFLGTINGSQPINSFFAPRNLIKLVGLRGFLKLARDRPR
jgi:flavin-dependent dehydrogenase